MGLLHSPSTDAALAAALATLQGTAGSGGANSGVPTAALLAAALGGPGSDIDAWSEGGWSALSDMDVGLGLELDGGMALLQDWEGAAAGGGVGGGGGSVVSGGVGNSSSSSSVSGGSGLSLSSIHDLVARGACGANSDVCVGGWIGGWVGGWVRGMGG